MPQSCSENMQALNTSLAQVPSTPTHLVNALLPAGRQGEHHRSLLGAS